MTNRPDCWPYKFKKVNGVWYRQLIQGGSWKQLTVVRVKTPPNPHSRQHLRQGEVVNHSLNVWKWQ